jgi:hypothetical protein
LSPGSHRVTNYAAVSQELGDMLHVITSSDLSSKQTVDCVRSEELNILYFTNLVSCLLYTIPLPFRQWYIRNRYGAQLGIVIRTHRHLCSLDIIMSRVSVTEK